MFLVCWLPQRTLIHILYEFFLDYTTHYHLDIRHMDLGATVVLTPRWPCNPGTEYYDLTLNPPMVASFPWSCTMTMHTKYKVQSTNNLLCFISSEGLVTRYGYFWIFSILFFASSWWWLWWVAIFIISSANYPVIADLRNTTNATDISLFGGSQ